MLAVPVWSPAPVAALVSAPIAIDGAYLDWAPVFEDAQNCTYDATGDSSSDNVDIALVAATWDPTYLYAYVRRASSNSGGAPDYNVFIDIDGDGQLETGDRVLDITMTGGNSYSGATLQAYVPANAAAGDPMPGDAAWPAGSWNVAVAVPGGSISGSGESGGVQLEVRLTWAALGIPAGSPVNLQFTGTQGSSRDSSDIVEMKRYGVTLTPDRTSGASTDTTVTYTHTLTNTGNMPATFNLLADSSRNWTTTITRADNGLVVNQVTLAAGASLDVRVAVRVPANAADGAKDVLTLTATHSTVAGTSASVKDTTTVGPVLVIPDRAGTMMPGGTIRYANTVVNNTAETRTVDLTASSSRGWTTAVYNAANTAPLAQVTLLPGASLGFSVRVSVPGGAAIGLKDTTTVQAQVVGVANMRGKGYDVTTCAPELAVEPNNASPAGPGTSITYRHTVTNSSATTRTVTLSATSSRAWTVRLFAADGSTPLASVTLPPYGGSANVVVRVTVPAGTAAGITDTTTLLGTVGALSDTATDITSASALVTFGISGFGTPRDTFDLGDRMYVRGMGLTAGSQVRFRFTDPGGTSTTSNLLTVDGGGMAQATYNIATNALIGQWTVTLLNSGGTAITSAPFYVGYKASITSMAVTGGNAVDSTMTATTNYSNKGAIALNGTVATYLMWWDDNGNGTYDAGDAYIAEDGTWTVYGAGTGVSHTTTFNIGAPNGSATDVWTMPNQGIQQDGTYHLTNTWRTSGGVLIETRETTFFAVPGGQWVELTLSTNAIDFGTVDPGVPYSDGGLGVQVKSNVGFDLIKSTTGAIAELGLTSTLANLFGVSAGTNNYTDIVSIDVPWDTDPGAYSAEIIYTVVTH